MVEQSALINNKYEKDLLVTTILNIISFYSVYFAFPVLFKLKNRFIAILAGITITLGISAIRAPIEFAFWKHFGGVKETEIFFNSVYFWNNFRLTIIIGIYSILISFMISWFDAQKLKNELINRQQAGELALLRSQINPHFLFNTLNNIYSLVYKKSDEAGAAVMKLSSIMRYMLYDTPTEKVSLDKEIDYLKSFIELQLLRIKHSDFVVFNIEGVIDGKSIAPMLLISFVENAFKHGSKNHNPGIIIQLTTLTDRISFQVVNYIKKTSLPHNSMDSGIGLSNIRRRLELIYPEKHDLKIYRSEDTYKVNLEILI